MKEEMAEVHEIVLPIGWTETEGTGHSFGVGTMLGHSFKLCTNARPLFLGGKEQGLVEWGGTDSASTTDGALDLPPGNAGCVSPARGTGMHLTMVTEYSTAAGLRVVLYAPSAAEEFGM
ncbi:hypothetical protein MRX96_003264 [Rhipicephalus microplus]